MLILAIFMPAQPVQWLLLPLLAIPMGAAWIMRKRGVNGWGWYWIPGLLSIWIFHEAHLHTTLGFLPIIPFMPHAHSDMGLWAKGESDRKDALSRMERHLESPVEIILGIFAFANAGIVLTQFNSATVAVWSGLEFGKPLGIFLSIRAFIWLANWITGERLFHISNIALLLVGVIAGIGFTVSMFMSGASFPAEVQAAAMEGAKMGALFSLSSAVLAFFIAWIVRLWYGKSVSDLDAAPAPA